MKFLVLVTPRQNVAVPPHIMARMLAAQREWVHQKVDDGSIESMYGFSTGGACAIVNVDSHEALNEMILDAPAFPISDREVRPLADIDVVLGNAVAATESAAAAMTGG